jgi:hypothetical protein
VPIAVLLVFYAAGLLYAALTYYLGPYIPLATIALGFGLLIFFYLAVEWVVAPVLAVIIGFQARWWSLPVLILFGAPVVILFTAISPVVSSGSKALGVPVPWLAVFTASRSAIAPIIQERLLWWGLLFIAAALLGRVSRRYWRLATSGA